MNCSRSPRFQSIFAAITAASVLASAPMATAHAATVSSLGLQPSARAAAMLSMIEHVPTSVLGLEGQDEAAAAKLTQALKLQFAAREMSGGQDMSLVELVLTMGCDDPPAPACIAEGGKTLNVNKLVYGKLEGDATAGYKLDIKVLDVETGAVDKSAVVSITAADLGDAALEATSKRIVDQVLGPKVEETTTTPTPAPAPGPGVEGPEETEPAPASSGGLIWGKDPNPPMWKKVGLWTSVGVSVAALGTAIGTTYASGPNGPIRKDLVQAAEDSPKDDNPDNDIDPNEVDDLCAAARAEPVGEPGKVTNATMTSICNKGDAVATVATASWIVFGVALLSTAAFATLMFVRKDKSKTAAALHRHGVGLGIAPSTSGVVMSGGFRF